MREHAGGELQVVGFVFGSVPDAFVHYSGHCGSGGKYYFMPLA